MQFFSREVNKGLTYAWDAEQGSPHTQTSVTFIEPITGTLSKLMVRRVKNHRGDKV